MVNAKPFAMSMVSFFLISLLLISIIPKPASAYYDVDIPRQTQTPTLEQTSGLISLQPVLSENPLKRYLVFGSGTVSDISRMTGDILYGLNSDHGSFAVGMLDQNEVSSLKLDGYDVIEDLPLEFYSVQPSLPMPSDVSRVDSILGSEKVMRQYNYDGDGIKIGIVDTGTDFSNPDVRNSLARDKDNVPVMIDADGQGLVLTNATFVAQISSHGMIQNYTKPIPKNVTSSVYVTSNGVFLDLAKGGRGTTIQVYNSQYPKGGTPVINGTVSNDYKIGKDARHFILSKSGMYHFGMIYESVSQGQLPLLQLVPVLVVDSKTAGVYDTIIPDMSDSYKDFTRITSPIVPKYDYDFTIQTPITLGNGKEFLVYDKNNDGNPEYSAGTVGARVLDLYGIAGQSAKIDKKIGAVNGTLLPPLDPHGNFFGVMYDYQGHGTATAASITSQGKQQYDIYGNSTKYVIQGVAPGSKIVPIKALWLGDAIYGWLWAAGFDQNGNHWKLSGAPRVDILSNSWGISTFPALGSVPGLDVESLLLSALDVPGSLDKNYPGILTVSSSGNAGPGYGTIGSPDAAPFGLTVGAATDNIFVGYGPFKGQPRFGNSTLYSGDISGFSSKGPSLIGDPKPDIMAIGEYSFTPTSVTPYSKNSTGQFSLFGGTSLAAPLVAGSAAIVMQALHDKGIPYNPFTVKNILMSTAEDLGNDPFAQGAGLINVTSAINYVLGKENTFQVYNNATYSNVNKVLNPAVSSMNLSAFGLKTFQLDNSSLPETPWFAGRLYPGDRTTAAFTIENPTDNDIKVEIEPQKLDLMKTSQYNGTTEPRMQDPAIKKPGVYRPDYVQLAQITNHTNPVSFSQKSNPIPPDASLLVLDLTFPFSEFMNSSAKTYADDIKISSLYLYDWNNKNNDTKPTYKNLSLVNRGGTWGTVQEVRVSDPGSKFAHVPLVGVYPVPTRYSYWSGDTKENSTSINYTITASYYKKTQWSQVWLDSNDVTVKPHSKITTYATLVVPPDGKPGIYQGFISFSDKSHTVNVPVSYVVLKKLQPKDLPTVILGSKGDTIFGNGYVGGGFDMSNRYNAGDWREYYFDVKDKTINAATMIISWEDPSTNLSVFVIDPQGKIIQTNVPAGILGEFQGWPSGDWLGPSTPFSEGGGFYPIKNKDNTSTEVYAPINQTGVYSVLIHTTLFGGRSIAEPITMAAKFSTILPDESPPQINLQIPQFINSTYKITSTITGDNIQDLTYSVDSSIPKEFNESALENSIESLQDGLHDVRITVSDTVGHIASKDFKFVIDNTPPTIILESPANGSTVSGIIPVNLIINETNPLEKNWLTVKLPNQTVLDNATFQYDTRTLPNGLYHIEVIAKDKAENTADKKIVITVNNFVLGPSFIQGASDQNFITLIEILVGIAIASLISVITFKKFRFSGRT
ncbi:MAG: S8 family serine peptidase [Thaumarchaeota archaeon]|nr:S8 family serine peptidase [Nitrososphaerota archaeon]